MDIHTQIGAKQLMAKIEEVSDLIKGAIRAEYRRLESDVRALGQQYDLGAHCKAVILAAHKIGVEIINVLQHLGLRFGDHKEWERDPAVMREYNIVMHT